MTLSYLFSRASYVQPDVVYDFYLANPVAMPDYPKPEENEVDVSQLPLLIEEKGTAVVARTSEMAREEAFLLTH
ncbi:MAG: hypothetical protein KOO63_02975 [Bacteroidales bacterium]|nr:hypothetical protein [Candidatus Latescibacterota bacterium]